MGSYPIERVLCWNSAIVGALHGEHSKHGIAEFRAWNADRDDSVNRSQTVTGLARQLLALKVGK